MHRLFVALRPPPPIRGLLAACQDGLAGPDFTPTHLVLYESRPGRDGAAYEPVARWPLA